MEELRDEYIKARNSGAELPFMYLYYLQNTGGRRIDFESFKVYFLVCLSRTGCSLANVVNRLDAYFDLITVSAGEISYYK